MKVDVIEVKKEVEERARINKAPLESIEFYDGDTKLDVAPKLIEEWKFYGLNNIDFIMANIINPEDLV